MFSGYGGNPQAGLPFQPAPQQFVPPQLNQIAQQRPSFASLMQSQGAQFAGFMPSQGAAFAPQSGASAQPQQPINANSMSVAGLIQSQGSQFAQQSGASAQPATGPGSFG
jgi:hypothetical protein